jgi:ferredoxin
MVKVDEEKCIGCGSCVAACEDVFEMKDTDDGQKATVKKGADTSKDCVKEAIDICPADAIS